MHTHCESCESKSSQSATFTFKQFANYFVLYWFLTKINTDWLIISPTFWRFSTWEWAAICCLLCYLHILPMSFLAFTNLLRRTDGELYLNFNGTCKLHLCNLKFCFIGPWMASLRDYNFHTQGFLSVPHCKQRQAK